MNSDLSRLVVRGRGAHIAIALAKCEAGHIEGSRYEAIESLKGIEFP